MVWSNSGVVAAFRAKKTKNEAAPIKTVTMIAIKLKIPAFRLLAMVESDLPKQAAQAKTRGAAPVIASAHRNATLRAKLRGARMRIKPAHDLRNVFTSN